MDVRTLSRTEAKVVLTIEAHGGDTVSLDEITRVAGISRGFARKVAHTLVRKGWLQRGANGRYLFNPSRLGPDVVPDTDPFRLGSLLAQPYYFAYGTAAELHGLLRQAGRIYYIASPARASDREFGDSQFRPVRVRQEKFFGFEEIVRRGRKIAVSNLERTILDCLSRPELSGGMGGVAHAIALSKPHVNWSRLGRYVDRLGYRSLRFRLGYLEEKVRPSMLPPASWTRAFLPTGDAPYVPLGPPRTFGRRGPHDARSVVQNVSDAELFSEGEIA